VCCIVQLLRTTGMTALDAKPLWDRAELSFEDLLAEYQRECGIVRRGINGDLTKVGSLWCRERWLPWLSCLQRALLEALRAQLREPPCECKARRVVD